ncbi:hypothetical protein DRQ26_03670 [bacterium]|nr:MAG: hypothetical protein DRQ26_03670 [bacterium]
MDELLKQKNKPLDKALSSLRERERYFRQIVQHMTDAMIVVDMNNIVRSVNPAAEKLLKIKEDDIVGQKFSLKVHSGKPGYHPIPFQTVKVRTADQRELIAEMRVTEVRLKGERFFMANLRDITELAQLREEKQNLPLIDEFTGLYNRRGLLTIAHYQLKTAEQTKRGMWMIDVELDNLDRIRKVLGEDAGGRAILESADLLRNTFRASDVIAYIDDNEFAVIAIGALKDSADSLKNRLLQRIKERNSRKKSKYKLSFSIGMAYFDPDKPCNVDELLARARSDTLMNE